MNLLCTVVEEGAHIVAQLRTAYYRVVAEDYSLVLQYGRGGYELHLGHQIASCLRARSERARPCRGVFQHRTLVRDFVAFAVAQCHAHSRVWYAAYYVGLHVVLLAEALAVGLANKLGVDAFVVACRETVVHPEERTYLLALERLLQHLDAVGFQAYYLARPEVAHLCEVEVVEGRSLARSGVCALLFAQDYRRAAQCVAGSNQAVFGQNEH